MNPKIFLIVVFSIFSLLFIPNERTITGTVISEDGEPIPGAVVKVKEYPEIATVTDFDGSYTLEKIPEDAKTLTFEFIGMEVEEVKIKKQEVINVTLKADEMELEEVVVTSMGVSKDKKSSGWSKKRRGRKGSSSTRSSSSHSYDAPKSDYDKTETMDYEYDEVDDFGDIGGEYEQGNIKSGQLTAGEIHDFSKWELWNDITENQLKQFKTLWDFEPVQRYCVQVTSDDGKPIINCKVQLQTKKGEIVWESRTDNTGKAELWANMFDATYTNKAQFVIQTDYQGKISSVNEPTKFHDGINKITIAANCDIPNQVEIAFVIDATGSMGDELQYIQAELEDVITRVEKDHKDLDVSLASVFYRDEGDDYLTVKSDFSKKKKDAIKFINDQTVGGGGDFPEAVHSGLDVAVNELQWSEDARLRIIFLVLDAPPHNNPEVVEQLQKITKKAAAKGIRIVPVTCSGVDKSTEYLMRSIALCTNGTYVFLTDDSGIGGSHIKPTTDKWDVELFNDLLVRLIDQYVTTPTCENEIDYPQELINDTTYIVSPDTTLQIVEDTSLTINPDSTLVSTQDSTDNNTNIIPYNYDEGLKFYPNPTRGPLTIEISGEIKELFLADNSGKLLQRFELNSEEQEFRINIDSYPSGMYFIQYLNKDKWMSGKIVLMH